MAAPDDEPRTVQHRDLLSRAMQVLTALVDLDGDAYGVRPLSEILDLPASSVHRVLSRLEELGMVSRHPDGGFQLGVEFYRLAWRSTDRFSLARAANGPLEEMARASNEAAFLGVYSEDRRQMMFAASVDSQHPVKYVLELGRWLPLVGASGLAILAFLPEKERRAVLESDDSGTAMDPTEVEQEVAEIRERGYAITSGRRIHGAVGIAAPILGKGERVLGDIGITMPQQRFDPGMEDVYASLVKRTAAHVSALLGAERRTIDQRGAE